MTNKEDLLEKFAVDIEAFAKAMVWPSLNDLWCGHFNGYAKSLPDAVIFEMQWLEKDYQFAKDTMKQ